MKNFLFMHGAQASPGSLSFLLIVGVVFLIAGWIKGIIGLGLPTVAIGLLGLVMAPSEAAVLLIVPSFVTNAWQLLAGKSFTGLWRRLWPMLAGITFGTLAGGLLPMTSLAPHASTGLGIALVLYALAGLASLQMRVSQSLEGWLSPFLGLITGLITAVTGVFVIPAVPYLQMLDLDKDDLMQALGLAFTVSTVALAISLGLNGAFHIASAGTSLLALAPALAGMFAGQWMREKISPAVFKRCFFMGLLALGLHLALS
jgi:uncharacterized membrane protein YfcA